METGLVNPEEYIPKFLDVLKANGVDDLIKEVEKQLNEFKN